MPDWYAQTGWPGQRAEGESAPGRSEFLAIAQSFAKMPTLTGRANRPVFVNASGTGLNSPTAADARGYLGGTTVGQALFLLANPTAIRFLRVNADNTVTALSASDFLTALTATTVGKALLSLADPSAIRFLRINADNTVTALSDSDMRTALGLGSMATQSSSNVNITGGTMTGVAVSLPTTTLDVDEVITNVVKTPPLAVTVSGGNYTFNLDVASVFVIEAMSADATATFVATDLTRAYSATIIVTTTGAYTFTSLLMSGVTRYKRTNLTRLLQPSGRTLVGVVYDPVRLTLDYSPIEMEAA
jgi:hypothetical protein